MIPLHMGALHPVEQALTLVLAFGPFVVLGIVIVIRRRAEQGHPARDQEGEAQRDTIVERCQARSRARKSRSAASTRQ